MSIDAEQILEDAIEAADKPKSVSTPAATVVAHSLSERMELAKLAGAQTQAASAGRLVFNKLVPPGAP